MHREFELRRKLLQLESLHEIGRALNTLRPEAELLEEMLHRAVTVVDAARGFVFSIDEKLQIREIFAVGLELPERHESVLEEPLVRRIFQMREAVRSASGPILGTEGQSILASPMIAGETLIGMVGMVGKEQRGTDAGAFVEDDLRFLTSMAAIGAAAIDNSRNFHRLELMRETLEDENRALKQRMQKEYHDRLMIGDSPQMQKVIDLVARVADSPASVLIRGESGTGKEMVARLIHGSSPRRQKPFVAINCAALPETLLESELFGIERGVATGVEARAGKFELAEGGTIFLDEIGDIPPALQAKLLRVLQEREFERVGGRRKIKVNLRLLAATHRDLELMIEQGTFRQDLYYRLKVVEILLPPLRERREDIPQLVRYFLDKYGTREGLRNVRIDQAALQKLMRYPFPGNVRELENLIEGALALTIDPVIDSDDLPIPGGDPWPDEAGVEGQLPTLDEIERRYIARILGQTGGNVSQAARILGIDRKTIYRKLGSSPQTASYVSFGDSIVKN
ncbi:MAG TPA: sigma 54-interacting transcriptional regulator [Thermoanaerobaculia bacterium]|nr:sigma 54-interacting transcriptional regulator [Thermoanaerobaculia bacterium]